MTEFSTHDTYFAAFLKTAGVPMLRMERQPTNRRRVYIVFQDDGSTVNTLRNGWIDGTAKVEARIYTETLKSLHASIDLV